jgi:LacI family transcriptional regulator
LNIREVAKKAGVSVATVSRVLNNSSSVSAETRKRVASILKQYNFQVDPGAKRLAIKKKNAYVLTMINSRIKKMLDLKKEGFYSKVITGIRDTASAEDLKIDFVEMEKNLKESVLKEIDGILLVGSDTTLEQVNFLRKLKIPLVLVDQYLPTIKVDCVISNGYDGACYAVNYLVSKGLKKIVHIHGFLKHFSFKDRYNGYTSVMEKNGLLPRTYEYNDEIMEDMRPLLEKMFNTIGIPDAIFTSNDPIAMKVVETLKDFGVNVPNEVSVVGFDGIQEAEQFIPSISTLRVPMHEMGSLALKRLMDIMYDQDIYPVKISLFTEFIKRSSSI